MKHVTQVESNVKGGVNVILGPKTVIVGASGRGKSAVVNAVELALSARASDVVGRTTIATPAELQSLAPGRKGELSSKAVLSDGTAATFAMGGKSKKPDHQLPAGIIADKTFPLRDVNDAVRGGVDTARKFFLTLACGALTEADVKARLAEVLHPYWTKATLAAPAGSLGVDRLLLAIEEAGKKKREEDGKANTSESLVEQTTRGMPAPPTEAELADAKARKESLQAALDEASRRATEVRTQLQAQASLGTLRQTVEATQSSVNLLSSQLVGVEERLNGLRAEREALPPCPMPLNEEQAATVVLIQALGARAEVSGGDVACPACGNHASNVFLRERATAAQQRVEQRAKERADYDAVTARIGKGEAILKSLQENLRSTNAALDQQKRMLADAERALGNGQGLPDEAQLSAEVNAARAALMGAEKHLQELNTRAASWASVNRARNAVVEARESAAKWEQLKEACTNAVAEFLDANIAGFVARVQKYLPAGYVFNLRLREGNREVCQHGFVRDEVLHTALSGAEWAIEQAAIAAAMCEVTATEGGVQVVVPEDRGFSPALLADVLRAFSKVPAQVLIATPTRPNELPEGWTLIDVDQGRNTASAAPSTAAPPAAGQTDLFGEPLAAPASVASVVPAVEPEKPKRTRRAKVVDA